MNDKVPAVSIIIPAWGVAHLLGDALRSIQAQDYSDWEALVVNDGASDIAAVVAPFCAADPRIRFVATPHGGVSAARNRGVESARAPLIALLDGDDFYLPGYLAKMVEVMNANPHLGIVSCDAIYTGDPAREGHRFSAHKKQSVSPTLAAVMERNFYVFIAVLMRREAFERAGQFDEELNYAEDLDLWVRVLIDGWGLGYVDEPLVTYRRRPGSASRSEQKLRQATLRLYTKTLAPLQGQSERTIAVGMIDQMQRELAWVDGEDLVLDGQVRRGLSMMTAADAKLWSPKWRMLMPVLRAAPFLARPLISMKRRRESGG